MSHEIDADAEEDVPSIEAMEPDEASDDAPFGKERDEAMRDTPTVDRGGRWTRAVLTFGFAGGVIAVLFSGAFGDPEETIELIRAAGPLGALAYLALFTAVQPFGVSGHLFTLAAAAIWDPPSAMILALLGSLGSASVSFAFARYVAFDWVQARIPPRVRRLEKWIVDRGLFGIVVYRFLTFTLAPAQLAIGTVRVSYPVMLLGTAIGFAPTIAVDVLLGGELIEWLLA